MIKKIDGDLCHDILVQNTVGKLAFKEDCNYDEWRSKVREKLNELLGMDKIMANSCPFNFEIEEKVEFDTYTQIRFTFDSEVGSTVPCYFLIPKLGKDKYPLAIALQGHTTGFHLSIGNTKYEGDENSQPRGAFGLQAVEKGFAALCIEQRGMGERGSKRTYGEEVIFKPQRHTCAHTVFTALNLGRTVIGERVWDVHQAITVMEENFSDIIDKDKIMVIGTSGGGTATFYASCFDERIKLSVPGCAFCSFKTSIFEVEHCSCNYIPDICNWFEMEDLACLIAPRNLLIIAGKLDPIFPIEGVRDSYEIVKKIYAKAGASGKESLFETPRAHYWCHDIAWDRIREEADKLGW